MEGWIGIENISLQSNEEIKPIKGYEGLYSITSFGRMWSHAKKRGFIRQKGKFLRYNTDKDGYVYYTLSKERNLKSYKSHILVAIHYIPNPQNLPEVNHKDGNKFNCRKDNLEWCTDRKNKNHALINNLYNKKSSKYYGVSFNKGISHKSKPWGVSLGCAEKLIYIGYFKTEIEAAQAYNDYVVKYKLNRPLNKIEGVQL